MLLSRSSRLWPAAQACGGRGLTDRHSAVCPPPLSPLRATACSAVLASATCKVRRAMAQNALTPVTDNIQSMSVVRPVPRGWPPRWLAFVSSGKPTPLDIPACLSYRVFYSLLRSLALLLRTVSVCTRPFIPLLLPGLAPGHRSLRKPCVPSVEEPLSCWGWQVMPRSPRLTAPERQRMPSISAGPTR